MSEKVAHLKATVKLYSDKIEVLETKVINNSNIEKDSVAEVNKRKCGKFWYFKKY